MCISRIQELFWCRDKNMPYIKNSDWGLEFLKKYPTSVQYGKGRQKEERIDEFLDRSLGALTRTHRIRYCCKSILYYTLKNRPKNVWTIFLFWIHVHTLTPEAMNAKVVTLTIETSLCEEGSWMGGEVRRAYWKGKWLLFVSPIHGRENWELCYETTSFLGRASGYAGNWL